MVPHLSRPGMQPQWRALIPAFLLAITFAFVFMEMRAARTATLAQARATLVEAQRAIAALNTAGQNVNLSDGHTFVRGTELSAIDFGCSAPPAMRLQAGCWLRGARGKYTGATVRRGNRKLIVGGLSQAGEDLFLLENFFFDKRGGTFLEMGGLDGLRYSNSYYFERFRGWTGVMIEGSPTLYNKLVKNRPGVVAINAMVCGEARELHWIETTGSSRSSDAVGGAWELMTEQFKKDHHRGLTPAEVAKLPTVPCVSLSSALERFGVRHVDLFSLDVEGAEASVLKTLDFSRFTSSVIVFEDRPGSGGVKEQLLKAGYVDYGWVNPNHIFLHPRFKATLPP